jgi:SAM-dependent methyltransferase
MPSRDESVVFDRAAHCYDATRGFPPGIDERVADLIADAGGLDRGSRLLEIGVGTGRIALPLAKRIERVVGVDLSHSMMQKLVAKRGPLGIDLARADATRLPFPDASFDAALGVHVFHLIPGWRAVLAELARVLRPGAPLLHGADDRSGDWARWRDRFGAEHRVENVGVPSDRLDEFPESEGWRALGAPRRIRYARPLTPRALVDHLAGRTWSFTWRMSDGQLAEAAEALRAELLQRYGDLDRPVETESGFWVRAFRSPR